MEQGLWMGVPVIMKTGNYFVSHIGESILHNANLPDWIATDSDDYIEKAIEFSSDLNALNRFRAGLRDKLRKTPLCDLKRFSGHFEYFRIWFP